MANEHIDIDHILTLCRIALTDEERQTISIQLDTMLTYLEQLKEADICNVKPTLHTFDIYDILRADQPDESFSVETVLTNVPEQKNNQIVVPRIVE